MNIIKRERVIPPKPEQTVTDTIYVASDGKEFRFKSECEFYEKQLEVQNHPVFKSWIKARVFWDDYAAGLYYIRNEEDYEFWCANIGTQYLNVDHWEDGFGPGWYLFYSVDGGDYADSRYLYKLDEYEREIRHQFDEWHDDVENRIANHIK